jgi:hypothetical protein
MKLPSSFARCVAGALVIIGLLGCSDGDPDPAGVGTDAGTSTQGAGGSDQADAGSNELEVVPAAFEGANLPLRALADGDEIPLSLPPQGGHVLFVGARMRNLLPDAQFVQLKASVTDPDTGEEIAHQTTTVVVHPVEGEPGMWETDNRTYSQTAMIAVCPDYKPRSVDGEPYVIELSVTEKYADRPRTTTVTRTVTPRCPDGGPSAELCRCECSAGYVLGKCAAFTPK